MDLRSTIQPLTSIKPFRLIYLILIAVIVIVLLHQNYCYSELTYTVLFNDIVLQAGSNHTATSNGSNHTATSNIIRSLLPTVYLAMWSAPRDVDLRDAQRQYRLQLEYAYNMGSEYHQSIALVFVLGETGNLPYNQQLRLMAENQTYGDMVTLYNHTDNRGSKADNGKVLWFWLYVSHGCGSNVYGTGPIGCRTFDWVMKGDPDQLIVWPNLYSYITILPKNNSWWGYCHLANSTWMNGPTMAVSQDILRWIETEPEFVLSNVAGYEDVQFSKWVQQGALLGGNYTATRICRRSSFIEYQYTWNDHEQLIVIHGLKSRERLYEYADKYLNTSGVPYDYKNG